MSANNLTPSTFSARVRGMRRLPAWPVISIVLLLIVSVVLNPGLVTVLNLYLLFLALIVWTASGESVAPNLMKVIWPFGVIIAAGLIAGIGADRYLYLKDFWYLSNPVVVICVGYVLYCCKPDVGRGLRAFVVGGALLSALYLIPIALYPQILGFSALRIRTIMGNGYYAPALAFIILFAYYGKWREGLKLSPWIGWTCFILSIAAMTLSFSRTTLLIASIGVLAAKGTFVRREWLRLGVIALVLALLFGVLRTIVDVDSAGAAHSFVGKLARSLDEITIREYTDLRSINDNWRGYETARALKLYFSGEPLQWLFGYGFGAQVNLGEVWLGTMHEIPILHNGYAYLLVKGGACAIVLYGVALMSIYLAGRRLAATEKGRFVFSPARILQAVTISLVVATWFIGGVFNKLDMFAFLLAAGFLLAALTRKDIEVT